MTQKMTMEILKEADAIFTDDHFVYTSGLHGSAYVNKDALYAKPELVSRLCKHIDFMLRREKVKADVIAGPAMGGIILSQLVGYHMGASAVYAEKAKWTNAAGMEMGTHRFAFNRGYGKLVSGKKVVVVEDVLNTGFSAKQMVDLVRETGGEVVAVAAILNRGGVTAASLEVPALHTLANFKLDVFPGDDCPLCVGGVPVNLELGKGREFLAQKAQAA